jgi:hypothetical protein
MPAMQFEPSFQQQLLAQGDVSEAGVLDASVVAAAFVGDTAFCVVGAGTCYGTFGVVGKNASAFDEAGWRKRRWVPTSTCRLNTV